MPVVIICMLFISSSIYAQDISFNIQAGSSINWMSTNSLSFSDQFSAGDIVLQAEGCYFFYSNYYVGAGLAYANLNGRLKQSADSFLINDHLLRRVNEAEVTYQGYLLNIPFVIGFENKKQPPADFYPYAGIGFIHHLFLDVSARYREVVSGLKYTRPLGVYNISYCFMVGLKWQFIDQTSLVGQVNYQQSILPIARQPEAYLKRIGLSVGIEYALGK